MTSEKSFQSYFMKQVKHGYRTEVIGNPGFPDCLIINGSEHSFVELKLLKIGPSGDRKLRSLFKTTQAPWYARYLTSGGERLFVVFRKEKGYGILHVTLDFVKAMELIRYREMKERFPYKEYDNLKELINENFDW
jgi:hypothetical protein